MHITTYTGKHINPVSPEKELIDIKDIAHALSLLCRGNGHVKTFFSVGQHCINCALEAETRGLEPRLVMAALLHDASECYLSDVPRPFKQTLEGYRETEGRMLSVIYEKFLGRDVTEEEEKIIKEIDDDLLYFDLRELLGEKMDREEPELKIKLSYDFVPFEETEKKYLGLYERIRDNI